MDQPLYIGEKIVHAFRELWVCSAHKWSEPIFPGSDLANSMYCVLSLFSDWVLLQAIQHMNTLKRLLRNAETDHYTLYR